MNNPDFAELKEKLCEPINSNKYISNYMQTTGDVPTYAETVGHHERHYSAIISELIDIIQSQSEALSWYHANAMTFKHCQEICPDVEEYCSGDLAKGVLSETNTRLQKLREGK
jgi:hypothetical protein